MDIVYLVNNCKDMYETKTKHRLESMIGTDLDKIKTINGVEVESIEDLLDNVQEIHLKN